MADVRNARSGARRINLAASPVPAMGGLGLVALGVLVALVRPEAAWFLVYGPIGGGILALVIVMLRRRRSPHA